MKKIFFLVMAVLIWRLWNNSGFIEDNKLKTVSVPIEPTETAMVLMPTATQVVDNVKVLIKKNISPTPTETWGVSRQVGEHTWTIKVGTDEKMATTREILEALNEYRKVHGSQIVTLDNKLTEYAQTRAKYLNSIKSVDQHKGFQDFLENQNGFDKLSFTALGENISYGYKLNGVHIIEWMYAGDKPHDDNQLDNRWNYVGIGVEGLATCLIFGTGKF